MDVTGQDMTWVPNKGKAPQKVRVKRRMCGKSCNVVSQNSRKFLGEGNNILAFAVSFLMRLYG